MTGATPECGHASRRQRLAIVATHPIQYYTPIYQALARHPEVAVEVLFAQRQNAAGQARAGFGVEFEWDTPLLQGYDFTFFPNRARHPDVGRFNGCHTPALAARIAGKRYDAVLLHGWASRSYLQAMRACWQTGTPVLIRGDSHLGTPRPLWKRLVKEAVYRRFIPLFDAYLWVGARAREYYLRYGASPDRLFFSPHCVDNEFFGARAAHFAGERGALRARWRVPPQAVCFLWAGKLIDIKRPMDFLLGIEHAVRRGAPVHALVVGDGPLRGQLESYAGTRQLPMTFVGFLNQSQMPTAYAAADVVVLPGEETWGLVVNEAMASGRAAIVSDGAGCAPDLIVPHETGGVYPCGDADALAAEMSALGADGEMVRHMGCAAKKHIEAYSVARAVSGILEALDHVGRKRATSPDGE
jgi:glycosyltransferase involved in cell wall biosynthesis